MCSSMIAVRSPIGPSPNPSASLARSASSLPPSFVASTSPYGIEGIDSGAPAGTIRLNRSSASKTCRARSATIRKSAGDTCVTRAASTSAADRFLVPSRSSTATPSTSARSASSWLATRRWPDSILLSALGLNPSTLSADVIRAARSRCDRPAALRAAQIRSPTVVSVMTAPRCALRLIRV